MRKLVIAFHAFSSYEISMGNLRLATFGFDITPPLGHSLCGGWITPVREIEDSLQALGFVLLGAGDPIVICALDWTGLLNSAHLLWRRAIAEVVGTTPDRVALHCVHQHDAPMVCLDTQALVQDEPNLPHIVQPEFLRACLEKGKHAISQALSKSQPLTHVASGQALIERIASNRRIARNDQGRVIVERRSFCRDPELCEMPDGLIDPWLKSVAFYNKDQRIAVCHYYATHPQSYYGEGRVSGDFVGLARRRHQEEDASCHHIYFTGCAGNISAGKYNDGSEKSRQQLTNQLYEGFLQSEKTFQPERIEDVTWRAAEIPPRARDTLSRSALVDQLSNCYYGGSIRGRAAFMLSWLNRVSRGDPLPLSVLRVNGIDHLHLPGECFVEYQLRAQQLAPTRFVATAAYGDGGPWYIPVKEEFDKGGYELTATFCDPNTDELLMTAIRELLN